MFNPDQRHWLADKLGDLANYVITALLVGQLLSDSFRVDNIIIGLLATAVCFYWSYYLLKSKH